MMKKYIGWDSSSKVALVDTPRRSSLLLLVLVAFCSQGCFGIGGSSSSNTPSSKTITTNSNGEQVGVNQAQNLFKGKIYLTIDHNVWVIDPSNNSRELLASRNAYDPVVSPNGKWIAFSARYNNYSNLDYMPVTGGSVHVLR